MMRQTMLPLCVALTMSGCTLLDSLRVDAADDQNDHPRVSCFTDPALGDDTANCDAPYWLSFWMDGVSLSWPERKAKIQALGKTDADVLKKILLSQGRGTPYQDRLRAQNWADQLLPKLQEPMQKLLRLLVYQPSQELLEFESALAILTRLNASQANEIEAQRQRLDEQQQQIEQLLKIEASMMKTQEVINQ